jgi:tetratricopeptide (TPR) repeat protein
MTGPFFTVFNSPRNPILWLFLVFCSGSLGCATAYQINSVPSEANVYYYDPLNQKKIMMGTTPLNYSKGSIPTENAFILAVEKEGYFPQEFPISLTDEARTTIMVTLKVDPSDGSRETKVLNEVVSRLFHAQDLIYQKKFHAAIVEIDKILKDKPALLQAQVMKGTAYYLLNELPSAIAAWKIALKLDPQHEDLNRFLTEKNISIK